MADRIIRQYYRQARFSRGSAAQWAVENPVLFKGEAGYEEDTQRLKVGDGILNYVDLPYVIGGADGADGAMGRTGPPGFGLPGEDADQLIIPGQTGATGASGSQGVQGLQGPVGPPGLEGEEGDAIPIPGQRGPDGAPGATGAQGPVGLGVPGYDGDDAEDILVPGPAGTAGSQGLTGSQGFVGPPGPGGEDGDDGGIGPPGLRGNDGAPGSIGAQGAQGLPGLDGDDAEHGLLLPGGRGADGAPGSVGTPGAQGAQGLMGQDGEDAEHGLLLPGSRGADGAPGSNGAQGSTGPPGMSVDGEDAEWLPGPQGRTGGIAQTYLGYNVIGATATNSTDRRVIAKKITVATAGLLASIDAYVDNGAFNDDVSAISVAVWDDSSGTPNRLIAQHVGKIDALLLDDTSGAGGNTDPRWLSTPVGIWLTPGDYWIGVQAPDGTANAGIRFYRDAGAGADRHYVTNAAGEDWIADWGYYTPTTTTDAYSIRGNFLLEGGPVGATGGTGERGQQGPVGMTLEGEQGEWLPVPGPGQRRTVTVGGLVDGNGAVVTTGVRPIWRVPYPCVVTAVRGYGDTGTTTTVNAGEITDGDFCSANIAIDPADAWEEGAPNQNLVLSPGDTLYIKVVNAGTATQVTVQVDLTSRLD